MMKLCLLLLCVALTHATYWKGLPQYDHPDFACYHYPSLCKNILEEIGCDEAGMTISGCPNYPETKGDLPNFVGTCTCSSPLIYEFSSTRVQQELITNRIVPDIPWMLEPWSSGPPYDMQRSYISICKTTLERLGCPAGSEAIHADPAFAEPGNNGGFICTCGNFKISSNFVAFLMNDYMNKLELANTPIFSNPVLLSVPISICIVFICGKIGAIIAVFFKLPPIVGYLLAGYSIQNFLSLMFLKGAGYPYPSPASELKLIALIIVLMRAGLAIKFNEIKANLVPCLVLCCIPYFIEFTGILLVSKAILSDWSTTQLGLFSSVMAPLGPSVVISTMLSLQADTKHDYGYIPQLILIYAPIEAVLAIVTFGIFSNLVQTEPPPLYPWVKLLPFWANIVLIPVNLIFSTVLGICTGWVVSKWIHYRVQVKTDFVWSKINKNPQMGSSTADLLFVFIVLCYTGYSLATPQYIQQCSGVLVVFVCAITVSIDAPANIVTDLSYALKSIWVFAEVILFTLTGTSITFDHSNGPLYGQRGLSGSQMGDIIGVIFLGLAARCVGICISAVGMYSFLPPHRRNWSEYLIPMCCTLFLCTIPKATVQATLGSVPYQQQTIPGPQGLNKGLFIAQNTAFTVLITAPLGTILIKTLGCKIAAKLASFDKENGWIQSKAEYDPTSKYYGKFAGVAVSQSEESDEQPEDEVHEGDVEMKDNNTRARARSRGSSYHSDDDKNLKDEYNIDSLVPAVRDMVHRMSFSFGSHHPHPPHHPHPDADRYANVSKSHGEEVPSVELTKVTGTHSI